MWKEWRSRPSDPKTPPHDGLMSDFTSPQHYLPDARKALI